MQMPHSSLTLASGLTVHSFYQLGGWAPLHLLDKLYPFSCFFQRYFSLLRISLEALCKNFFGRFRLLEIISEKRMCGWLVCFLSSCKPIYRRGSIDTANCLNGRRKSEKFRENNKRLSVPFKIVFDLRCMGLFGCLLWSGPFAFGPGLVLQHLLLVSMVLVIFATYKTKAKQGSLVLTLTLAFFFSPLRTYLAPDVFIIGFV